ncbi:Protein ViaA [Folsomia candida]|uniref:Protein ViaA n=1 Tax=Folsomia candida TaxID=158441 RepID=A0A226D1H7_FOLCA|nr:Protein ViaA [Folsomia candida]
MGRLSLTTFVAILLQLPCWTNPAESNVWISPSAVIREIEDARVYSDQQEILFLIPDLPDAPKFKTATCREKDIHDLPDAPKFKTATCREKDTTICDLIVPMNKALVGVSQLFETLEKQFTFKGINGYRYNSSLTQSGEEFNDPDLLQSIQDAGPEWFAKTNTALKNRRTSQGGIKQIRSPWSSSEKVLYDSILNNDYDSFNISRMINTDFIMGQGTDPSVHRDKRGIDAVASKILVFAKPLAKLFYRNGQILPLLTRARAALPNSLKYFLDIPEFVSELISTEERVANTMSEAVGSMHWFPTSSTRSIDQVFSAAIILQYSVMHYQTLFHVHSQAVSECRNGLLPMGFVPPAVLKGRLEQIKQQLQHSSSDEEMIIHPEDFSMY